MFETRRHGGSSPSGSALRSIAASFFGGATLATVATASLAQSPPQLTYEPTAMALFGAAITTGSVVLGGNTIVGDGGGGVLMLGAAGCVDGDGGLVFPDGTPSGSGGPKCFYRANPT